MELIKLLGVSFFTSVFTNVISYYIQRKHKMKDAFKAEKDKKIVAKTYEIEVKLFEIVNSACNQYIGSSIRYIDYANEINTIRKENIIFISDSINLLCKDIADYLLLIAVDPSKIKKKDEQEFIRQFKKKFRN